MYAESDEHITFTTTFIHGEASVTEEGLRLSTATAAFLGSKEAEGCSPHTLADYRNTLTKFAAFLGDPLMAEIVPGDIERFLAQSDARLAAKTRRNYHTGLSSLWTWALRMGHLEDHIVRRVKAPKADQREVQPLDRLEVRALLAACERTQSTLRNQTLLLFLLDTGLRASEVTGLRLGDLDGAAVRVMGKGKKERRVPLSSTTMQTLSNYLRSESHRIGHDSPLFPSSRTGGLMDRHGLRKLLARLGETSGVSNPHPHRFRHTFALNYLRNGGDVYTLQAILGHSTLDMVKHYLAIAQIDIQGAHEKASPVKGFGIRPKG